MNFNEFLSHERYNTESTESTMRDVYEADADRILFCEQFRLLGDKTQVHGPTGNAYVRSRLTHSMEVSRVARTLGKGFSRILQLDHEDDFANILTAAGLLHDIGNPPFGHSGEDIISKFFAESGNYLIKDLDENVQAQFLHFEGNAQALRIASKKAGWREGSGLGLSASVLAATMKYPYTVNPAVPHGKKNKYGAFVNDASVLEWVGTKTNMIKSERGFKRHFLAHLSEAADDICYCVVDVEDAAQLGIISLDEARDLLGRLITSEDMARARTIDGFIAQLTFLRSRAIKSLITHTLSAAMDLKENMLDGSLKGDLILETPFKEDLIRIKRFSSQYIYNNANRRLQDRNAETSIQLVLEKTSAGLMAREKSGGPSRDKAVMMMRDSLLIPYTRVEWLHALCDHIVDQTDRTMIMLYESLKD